MTPDDPRHGTNAGHRAHFADHTTPCQPCRDAHAAYRRNLWRKKYLRRVDTLLVPTLGTIRRIHALQAIGWRLVDIDLALGHGDGKSRGGPNYVHNLTRQQFIHRDTAERVAAAYDKLSMTPGTSQRSKDTARKHGWPPPLAWDDIDDPDEQPSDWEYRPERQTRADTLLELCDRGASISEACRVLKVSRDSLWRWCDRWDLGDLFERLAAREHRAADEHWTEAS